jgi:hypothetical protein
MTNFNGQDPLANTIDLSGDITIGGVLTTEGGLLLPDGTDSAPSLAFISDTKTGLEKSGTSEISFVSNGSKRLKIGTAAVTSLVPVLTTDGTVAAPSVSFTGDSTTGLYRKATDHVIGLAYGGTAVATFNSTATTLTSQNLSLVSPSDASVFKIANGATSCTMSLGTTTMCTMSPGITQFVGTVSATSFTGTSATVQTISSLTQPFGVWTVTNYTIAGYVSTSTATIVTTIAYPNTLVAPASAISQTAGIFTIAAGNYMVVVSEQFDSTVAPGPANFMHRVNYNGSPIDDSTFSTTAPFATFTNLFPFPIRSTSLIYAPSGGNITVDFINWFVNSRTTTLAKISIYKLG